MRLNYLVSQYPAITHTFILREIRALRQQGFAIQVISIQPPDRPFESLTLEEQEESKQTWSVLGAGFPAWAKAHVATLASRPAGYFRGAWSALRLARWNLRAAVMNLAYFAEAVIAGQRMLSSGVTHFHTHFSSTVALFLTRVFPELHFSATIHGPEEFDDVRGFFLAEKVAESAFLVTISQYARSQTMRASRPEHWHKIHVAALGVDPELFTPRPHRDQPERVEVLSVGRLAPAKAHALLIEAVGKLVRNGVPVRLRIAGGGPEAAALQALIRQSRLENHVVLEGPCNQDRIQQLYRETDVFALASFAEGVPVVLMEAMAMEIPCVATWVTGIPELIRHGQDGWLVAPSDPDVFAEALETVLRDSTMRQTLGQAGRRRVQEKYHLGHNTERLAEIFRTRLGAVNERAS